MARCGTCDKRVLFGAVEEGDRQYCSDECHQAAIAQRASRIPDFVVVEHAQRCFEGPCAVCDGPGPIDLHVAHRLLSAIVFTRLTSAPLLSCKECGREKQRRSAIITALFGWWSIAGIFMTPVYIFRNLEEMVAPVPERPSARLLAAARLDLVHQGATALPRAMTKPQHPHVTNEIPAPSKPAETRANAPRRLRPLTLPGRPNRKRWNAQRILFWTMFVFFTAALASNWYRELSAGTGLWIELREEWSWPPALAKLGALVAYVGGSFVMSWFIAANVSWLFNEARSALRRAKARAVALILLLAGLVAVGVAFAVR